MRLSARSAADAMNPNPPRTIPDLQALAARGEGPTVEFKKNTGELKGGMQSLCAFLNGRGGLVLFGVDPAGKLLGQDVSDATLRDIAQALDRFEPPASVPIERLTLASGREVIVLVAAALADSIPFTWEDRPYERVASTTRRMSQEAYEKLLLERAHSRRRWENQSADEISPKDIDREEVFRIVGIARSVGRLVGPVGRSTPDILARLGLFKDGHPLRAAVVLFGKRFLPDYPQCELRMARFRGTDKTEFLDQRQLRGPAFKLLEEAEIFCQRHFPMPAKIVPTQMRRVEKPLIPPDAMREILVNALIHRDYTIAGGAVSLAIFDDRVEVWSAGDFPKGITAASLTRHHPSVQRNPMIAEVFYRTGLIEKWGRGTNRVVSMCRDAGIAPPRFEEIAGAAVVTFVVPVGETQQVTAQVTTQVTAQVVALLEAASREPQTREKLQQTIEIRHREHFRKCHLEPLLRAGWLERTIPARPNSRLQKYVITEAGRRALAGGTHAT